MRNSLHVKIVKSLWVHPGKTADLYALSTVWPKYLTSQVILCTGFWTGFKQPGYLFAQLVHYDLNLFGRSFYTLPTGPMDNTNLIKDY
jgi:hypothetical protein